jgi:hypothetical protein
MFSTEQTTVYSEKYLRRSNQPTVCVQNSVPERYSRLYIRVQQPPCFKGLQTSRQEQRTDNPM